MRKVLLFGAAGGGASVALTLRSTAVARARPAAAASTGIATLSAARSAARPAFLPAAPLAARSGARAAMRGSMAGQTALAMRGAAISRVFAPIATGAVQALSALFRGGSTGRSGISAPAPLAGRMIARGTGQAAASAVAALSLRSGAGSRTAGTISFGVVALAMRATAQSALRAAVSLGMPLAWRSSAMARLRAPPVATAALASRQRMVLTLTPMAAGKTALAARMGAPGTMRAGMQTVVPLLLAARGFAMSAMRGLFGLQAGYIGAQMINIQMF